MQSGISASAELSDAFNKFTSNSSLFALPITIHNEALQALDAIPFTNASDFKSSLPSLAPHLQPKTPIYLLLRKSSSASSGTDLVAVTYVPSTAPVRSKTLFASTRASLIRDLGLEKFTDTLFATDAEEVLDPSQWEQRLASQSKSGVDTTILSTEERELHKVKRAEEEERHGTSGRDLMGSGGSGRQWGPSGTSGTSSSGVRMKVTDDAKAALTTVSKEGLSSEGGSLVQFGIDLSTETLELLASTRGVTPADVHRQLPENRPSYSFYHFPGTEAVLFIYTCPGTSKVRERMVYASSKNGVIELAKSEGVDVVRRLEAGSSEDISEQRLKEEAGITSAASESTSIGGSRGGFAKPKRPGKR